MRPTTVRWIAVAVIAGMLGVLVVAAVAGGGGDEGDEDATDSGTTRSLSTPTALVEGPHVVVQLCTGTDCPEPDEAAQQALADEIDRDGRVASTRLVTSEQAYRLFLQEFGDNADLVAETDPEEVPARIEVDLLDPGDADALVSSLRGRDGVLTAHAVAGSGA